MDRRSFLRSMASAAGIGTLAALWSSVHPGATHAQPVADFPAPMTAPEADRTVALAQQAEHTQRTKLANSLGLQDPALLPHIQNVFFEESGQHLSDRSGFLSFWRKNNGKLLFGQPVTGELVEDGRIVQYFERARFEYHPEHVGSDQQVLLSLVGQELFAGRGFAPGSSDAGTRFFPETGHTLSGRFLSFWHKRGGLPVFGYPISEPFDETSPTDGQVRVTQYFERARFEYVPEDMDAFYRQMELYNGVQLATLHEIRLTNLGRQLAEQRGHRLAGTSRLVNVPTWAPGIWERHIEVNLSSQWLFAFENNLQVYDAPVATGKDGFNTPAGSFAIYSKLPMQTMVGSSGGETWNVPDIPWVQYVVGGCALHGTYWHDAWGSGARMSHGCINLNIDDAQWLYEWADIGTLVQIYY